jgi:predicted ABC-type ATPase
MPQIIIIAGPDGAGRTSFANKHLDKPRADLVYVDADEIARDLIASGLSEAQRKRADRTRDAEAHGMPSSLRAPITPWHELARWLGRGG